jgi:DNA-binding response OmpR family regulator
MAAAEARRAARIMVVDDDPDTVSILAHHLEREGFIAIQAVSGAECLRIAHEHEFDIILLDLMMPDMDGFDVCRALKDDPHTAEIPIIMITARDDLDARAEGIRLGVSDFLAKPVFRRQLASRIRAQLEILAAGRASEAALNDLERENGRKPVRPKASQPAYVRRAPTAREAAGLLLYFQRMRRACRDGRAHALIVGGTRVNHKLSVFHPKHLWQAFDAVAGVNADFAVPSDFHCHDFVLLRYFQ